MIASSPRPLATAALAATLVALAMPAQAASVGGYHILPTPDYLARTGRAAPDAATAGSMLYYGGSVFGNVKVVSVIWGPNVNATTVAGIPGFTAAMVDSTYVDPLSEYDTNLTGVNGIPGTNQHIARGTYLGQVQITPKNTSMKLSDLAVQKELKYQIKSGKLPKNDLNTLYMVYFPLAAKITLQGLHSCLDFGAYHFAANDLQMVANNLFYSVEPDCGYSFPSITHAASHEFVEATTDNIPTPGTTPALPQAWNTFDGYEIGDLCGGSGTLTAGTRSYTVTQYYRNSLGACSTGNYTSP